MKKSILGFLILSIFSFGQRLDKIEKARILAGNQEMAMPIFNINNKDQHRVLLDKSKDIKPKNKLTKMLIHRMNASLQSTTGVGIAAPQVGINRNVVLAKRFDKPNHPIEYFINPKIIWRSEILNRGWEGDLSIDIFGDYFYRSHVIRLEYFDNQGKKHQENIEGFTAVILQHEIDHLSGILINDKIRNQNEKTYQKVEYYLLSL